jgi:hypothetical protein
MPNLPPIGRNGLVNSVRKLSGGEVPGWKSVDPSADFIAGMVCKLGTLNGKVVLQAVSGTDDKPVGLFFCHKTTSFYVPMVEYKDAPDAGETILLSKANLLNGSVAVLNTSTGTAYTVTTNYTVSLTNGVITNVNIAKGTALTIQYRYTDPNLTGIDQTLGSGNASYLSDPCEVATLVYDTTRSYSVGDTLYVTTGALVTNNNSGTTTATIGTVTKPPTASDPELYFRLRIA